MYTTANIGSESIDEISLDVTPESKIMDSTFAFNTKNIYDKYHLNIIKNWKEHISTMGKYNKDMIQESNIIHQTGLIEK